MVAGSNPVSPIHCRSKTVSEKSGAVFFVCVPRECHRPVRVIVSNSWDMNLPRRHEARTSRNSDVGALCDSARHGDLHGV